MAMEDGGVAGTLVLAGRDPAACYIWDEVRVACTPRSSVLRAHTDSGAHAYIPVDIHPDMHVLSARALSHKTHDRKQELALKLRQNHRIIGRFVGRRRPGSNEVLYTLHFLKEHAHNRHSCTHERVELARIMHW